MMDFSLIRLVEVGLTEVPISVDAKMEFELKSRPSLHQWAKAQSFSLNL